MNKTQSRLLRGFLVAAIALCVMLYTTGCASAGSAFDVSDSAAIAPEPLDESLFGWLTDARVRERYPLSFAAPPEAKQFDPKWHDGLKHMLANPEPLPPELQEYFDSREP